MNQPDGFVLQSFGAFAAACPPARHVYAHRFAQRYYVRDGHHRLSVARALGQEEIEALVTVWEVANPPQAASRPQAARWTAPRLQIERAQ